MKNLKTSGIVLLLALGLFSCTKPEPVAQLRPVETAYVAPCEQIKYIDFETATNWYGNLYWSFLGNASYTFKFKAWQLKTGQTNLAAIANNAPILVKDLNNTNITVNTSGEFVAFIEPMNTHVVDAVYTATIIYIIETYDANNIKQCDFKANSYRYSRSNKQKG
jgi:hypothetical protein